MQFDEPHCHDWGHERQGLETERQCEEAASFLGYLLADLSLVAADASAQIVTHSGV